MIVMSRLLFVSALGWGKLLSQGLGALWREI